jgi:RNA-directed DNA polymerase
VDGMTVDSLPGFLRAHGSNLKTQLLNGTYRPQPLRKVAIPKPDPGKYRILGIPTVRDRFVEHTILQILQPIFEPKFSRSSFGFRPGRDAHQAIRQGRRFVAEGFTWVVHVDLDHFFDSIPHDLLLRRLKDAIDDQRVLELIQRLLTTPFQHQGHIERRTAGASQGGPLSPLLGNVILHDWDTKIERDGLCFCRYADDVSIYVATAREGRTVMAEMIRFLETRLRLKVNREKSIVAPAWERTFLGYILMKAPPQLPRPAPQSWAQLRKKVLAILQSSKRLTLPELVRMRLNPLLRGWGNYFALEKSGDEWRQFDCWLRQQVQRWIIRESHGVGVVTSGISGSNCGHDILDQAGLISFSEFALSRRKCSKTRSQLRTAAGGLPSRHYAHRIHRPY